MTTATAFAGRTQSLDSTRVGTDLRVAFQGELGAYGDEAITRHWQGEATAVPSATFHQVIADVAHGFADLGIIPVWNTIVGDVEAGLAAIETGLRSPFLLHVLGDTRIPVRHQLLGAEGSSLAGIRSVESHPVALAQCAMFLDSHPRITPVPSYDTAGAARQLALAGSRTSAAIASSMAAKLYGLSVLQADIQDVADNVTRFLIVARTSSRSIDGNGMRRW